MKENFDIFDFELSSDDMEAITTLDMKTAVFLTTAILKLSNGWAVVNLNSNILQQGNKF